MKILQAGWGGDGGGTCLKFSSNWTCFSWPVMRHSTRFGENKVASCCVIQLIKTATRTVSCNTKIHILRRAGLQSQSFQPTLQHFTQLKCRVLDNKRAVKKKIRCYWTERNFWGWMHFLPFFLHFLALCCDIAPKNVKEKRITVELIL